MSTLLGGAESRNRFNGEPGAPGGMAWDEGGLRDPETEYVRMFNQFFTRGKMSSTYKPVFLRCLLDLGKYRLRGSNSGLPGSEWVEVDGDTVTLDLNFIAARFVKYYWDMDHSFRLKQSSNPADANIVPIVRDRHRAGKYSKPAALEELASDSSRGVRLEAIRKSIKPQVLKYLLTDMPGLYARKAGSNKIRLDASLIPFLERHRVIIKNGINYKLATYLEKLNKTIPQIAAKLDEESYPPRALNGLAERAIDREQEGRCFYCDAGYWEEQKRHIDHVIPFNYIFSTDAYNCVAACVGCNLQKHDRLPHPDLFSGVVARNDDLRGRLPRLPKPIRGSFETYDRVWYERTYTACSAEYHGKAKFFSP